MKRYLTILGMPGAGKDTQAETVAVSFPSVVVKTGDIARRLAETDLEVKETLSRGGLISDELINKQVAKQIKEATDDSLVIFDGFPRRLEQAQWLDSLLGGDAGNLRVCYLEITRETASSRLLGRKRADDNPDVIRHRLEVFVHETAPVLDYYRSSDRLITINGEPSVEVIAAEIHAKVSSWL